MEILPAYRESFFFSQKRKDGLRLHALYTGDHVYADFRIDERFKNEVDRPYNGILFGIMDSLMWYALIMQTGKICMTRKTTIECFTPIPCNITYRAKSRLLDVDEKDFYADSWIEDQDGRVYTKVSGLFKESRNTNIEDVINNLDFTDTTPWMRDFFNSLRTGVGFTMQEKHEPWKV